MADSLPDDWEDGADDWEESPTAPAGPSEVDSFLRGGRQGAALGFADEDTALKATALGVGSDALAAIREGRFSDLAGLPSKAVEGYRTIRDAERRMDTQAREANPKAFIGGEIVGGAPAVLLPGGTGRTALSLAAGAGALSGAGISEAASAPELAADTVIGGALGAGGQVGGQVLGEQLGRGASALAARLRQPVEDFAAMRALNAAGYFKNELKPIIRDGGKERAVRMGQALLDEPGVIQPGRGVDAVLEGIQGARGEWGAEMGRILQQADATGVPFDMSRVARRVMDEVIQPNLGDPAIEREVGAVGGLLRRYLQKAQQEGGLSFSEANRLKSTLDGKMNWGNRWNNFGPSEHLEKYQKQLAGIFRDEIDTQLGGALDEGAMAAFKDAKFRVGTFKDAEGKARNLNAAVEGNNGVNLKDLGVGAVAGGGVPGFLAVGLSKAGRERGASVLARGADNLATSLDELARTNPAAFGKYAGVVTSALARGPEALRAVEKVLNDTDPEWRAMRQQQTKQRE